MRHFNETTITDAVLDRIADAGPPRITEISEALVRKMLAGLPTGACRRCNIIT